jgi:hypothetical protein
MKGGMQFIIVLTIVSLVMLTIGYFMGHSDGKKVYWEDVLEYCDADIQYYKNLSYWEGIKDGLYLSTQKAPELTWRNEAEWREAVTSCLEFGTCG